MALTTISEYKSYAGISGSTLDSILTTLLSVAQDQIERYCDRPAGGFESGSKTENVDGTGSEYMLVKCWPVTSVTTLKYRTMDGSLVTVAASDYRLEASLGRITRTGAASGRFAFDDGYTPLEGVAEFATYPQFAEGLGNYEVVYVGGFSTVPDALKLAVWKQMDHLYGTRRKSGNAKSESIGDYSITYADGDGGGVGGLTESVRSILVPFRRVW
jgi:hypothetical protein